MTDIMFTHTALIEAAETAGVTINQARAILEAAGVTVQPEKPEPGTWHIVKDGPQVGDAARVDEDGYLHVIGSNGKTLRDIHPDNTWPALTPARVAPVTELEAVRAAQDTLEELAKMGVAESDRGAVLEMAARLAVHGIDSDEVDRMVKQHYSTTATTPVTLTEDQVGEVWDQECGRGNTSLNWATFSDRWKRHITATANAALAQYAAPAEGEPIDVKDVREGDRVRVELRNGDEATFTVTRVDTSWFESGCNCFLFSIIHSVRLLHREEA